MEKRNHRSNNLHAHVPPFRSHCLTEFEKVIGRKLQRSALPALCKYDEIANVLDKDFIHGQPCIGRHHECHDFDVNPCDCDCFDSEKDCGCEEKHEHHEEREEEITETVRFKKRKDGLFEMV